MQPLARFGSVDCVIGFAFGLCRSRRARQCEYFGISRQFLAFIALSPGELCPYSSPPSASNRLSYH